jgi:hypothetical protein
MAGFELIENVSIHIQIILAKNELSSCRVLDLSLFIIKEKNMREYILPFSNVQVS